MGYCRHSRVVLITRADKPFLLAQGPLPSQVQHPSCTAATLCTCSGDCCWQFHSFHPCLSPSDTWRVTSSLPACEPELPANLMFLPQSFLPQQAGGRKYCLGCCLQSMHASKDTQMSVSSAISCSGSCSRITLLLTWLLATSLCDITATSLNFPSLQNGIQSYLPGFMHDFTKH